MVALQLLTKRCQICLLMSRIRLNKRRIERTRQDLISRNNKYHGGRLEVDDMLKSITEVERKEIYNLKREIVKIR